MAKRKFAKNLLFSLTWTIFLSLLITNWDALKSVRWQDLFETSNFRVIGEFLKQNAGDIFFFGLCTFIIPDFPLADLVDYADKVGGLAALAHSPANHARFRLGTDSRRRSLPGLPCHLAPIANTKPCSVDNVC